jgi:hypothetical protein
VATVQAHYTPGPWACVSPGRRAKLRRYAIQSTAVQPPRANSIARTNGLQPPDVELANARLLAAGPAMELALQQTLRALRFDGDADEREQLLLAAHAVVREALDHAGRP